MGGERGGKGVYLITGRGVMAGVAGGEIGEAGCQLAGFGGMMDGVR